MYLRYWSSNRLGYTYWRKVLDENEKNAGLKQQYIDKIDKEQEKYSFEQLFEKIPNKFVEPELFALYAATDSYMTFRLYKWQKYRFELYENTKLYNMFLTLEMPLVKVIAEMELAGMEVDKSMHNYYQLNITRSLMS